MHKLTEILSHYGIKGEVTGTVSGPLITQIKFRPDIGTKLKTLTSVLKDIQREYGVSSLRISDVCTDNCIGFEIPNDEIRTVDLVKILSSEDFSKVKGELVFNLGVTIDGSPVFADLAKMPHLLIAGATGSGKSVALNAIIISLMAKIKDTDLKFVLIDPKQIEFSIYNNLKYLLTPVITETKDALNTFDYLIDEMNRRYRLFAEQNKRNIEQYHQSGFALPYIVVIVDEFSDLVLSNREIESKIQILAQKSRAAGIHLILATQRPSTDVVNGSIKANFPARIAFKTASRIDSQTVIDTTGAEDLLGRGDALYLSAKGELSRIHGAYIDDNHIQNFLQPFRENIKPLERQSRQPQKNRTKANSEKFSILGWIVAFWNSLGRRRQKKFLKFLIDLFVKKN